MESSDQKVYRGPVLNPQSSDVCDYYKDGYVAVENGVIVAVGDYGNLNDQYTEWREISIDKNVMAPAFCDIHHHPVQIEIQGTFEDELMTWLRQYTWPEEKKYGDDNYADGRIDAYYRALEGFGTHTGMAYSSIHAYPTERIIEKGQDLGFHIVTGNVLMDSDGNPDYLRVDIEEEIRRVEAMIERFGDQGLYAISPRFAPSCTMELMKKMGELARKSGVFVQTHLAESQGEIDIVRAQFPDFENYTDVYRQAGLLTDRAIFGHCIHMTDEEYKMLADAGSAIAHCPRSNTALGSGRMPIERVIAAGVSFALGTDIGAGPDLSMLGEMAEFMRVHNSARDEGNNDVPKITGVHALYRATLAGAEIMRIDDRYGNLDVGKCERDIVLLERPGKLPEDAESVIQYVLENPTVKSLT